MTAAFSLDRVTKRYRTQTALDEVSLSAEPGQVVALLGENGAGKTTAIKILLGMIRVDSGSASVLGLDSRRNAVEIRSRVGYVPDQPALYDWMTVAETGWFAAGFYPLGYQDRYRAAATRFGLPLDKRVRELSKGMRAKVSLALATAHEPELLILDEPTSGLDPIIRREFLESMVDVAAENRTVLLASHQIAEVERIADTIAILREGKLILLQPLETLKEHIRELTFTIPEGPYELPAVPGKVVHTEWRGRQCRVLVHGLDEGRLEEVRSVKEISQIDMRRPSLEDIYIDCMRGDVKHVGAIAP